MNGNQLPREGDAVLLSRGIGMVRYIGPFPRVEGEGYGIELVTPDGNTDGSIDGKEYFKCKPDYGVFVSENEIKRRITPQELLNKIGLLNKKMKTLKANSDPFQNPQIQMKMQELRDGYETATRQKKKVQHKLVEIAKDNKELKRQIKELQMTVESLESKNAAANELAQAAMEEKGQFAQQALAYKQRLLEIENDIQEREMAGVDSDESDITIESALEDEVGHHVRVTTAEQLREEQEFSVEIDERPTGIRFGHEDEGQTLVVHSVTRGKLGERVGIRPGDIVLSINGEMITDSEQALQMYRTVDLPLELSILRTQTQVANEFEVVVQERPAGIRFKHEDNGGTLVVNEVIEGQHGEELGIRPGDIIVMVQQESVPDSETMLALYREAATPFTLRLYRNKSTTSFVLPLQKSEVTGFLEHDALVFDPVAYPSFRSSVLEFIQPGDSLVRVGKNSLYGREEAHVSDVIERTRADADDNVLVQFERNIRSYICRSPLEVHRAHDEASRLLSTLNEGTIVNISDQRGNRGKMVYPLVGWVDLQSEDGTRPLEEFDAQNPADALGKYARQVLQISLSDDAVDDIMHFAALHPHQDFVCSVQWSPVEDVCASGASDNTMRLWRVKKNRSVASLSCYAEFTCKECVYCIAFSPDGQYLAAALYDNTVEVREVSTGRLEAVLGEHDYFVWQVRFTPDGKMLVSSAGKYIYIWQTQPKWKLVARLQADGGGVWGVGLSPDGRYVATSGNDNTVKIWRLDTCDFVASLIGHTRRPMCVVFTFDGRFLISGGDDRQIRIWGVQDGKCRAVLAGHQDNVRALAVTHDGLLASASDDNTIKLWNLQTGHCIRTMIGHQDAVRDVAFNRTGQYLCSGSNDNTMRVWVV